MTPHIQWNAELETGLTPMDDTHREFVTLYNDLVNAAPEEMLARFDAFIAHTEAHFDQENRWMEAVNFPGCHRAEHDRVLTVVRDVRKRLGQGDDTLARRLIAELPEWFDGHAGGMDAALAFHLSSIGFDVQTGAYAPGRAPTGGNAPTGSCTSMGAAATTE